MKKLMNSFIVISLIAAPICAAAQYAGIDSVLARTDSAISSGISEALEGMPVFAVPAPVSIAPVRASEAAAADYLPLGRRAVYEYEYTSSEFPGVKTIRIEHMEYSQETGTAKVNMIIFNKTNPKVSNFVMTAGASGIRSADSPLAGPRLEIPFPCTYNLTWSEGSDRSRISALNGKVTVPAGTYDNCLKISTRVGGGDAGSAERYYAPGVGLVYEQIIAEDRQETIKLTSYRLK